MPTAAQITERSRKASDIYQALCCSRIDPANLSEAECNELMHYCMEIVENWSSEAVRERRRGRPRIARQYQTRLFENLASRLVAAWLADRKTRRGHRRKQRLQGRVPVVRVTAMERQQIKDEISFAQRLANEAQRARELAYTLPLGKKRDALLEKARLADLGARINGWLPSPKLVLAKAVSLRRGAT
jgi:hypothetical protein